MQSTSPILTGFPGSQVAGLGTGLGALPIFGQPSWKEEGQRLMLAVAGGLVFGATSGCPITAPIWPTNRSLCRSASRPS